MNAPWASASSVLSKELASLLAYKTDSRPIDINSTMCESGAGFQDYGKDDIIAIMQHHTHFESSHQTTTLSIPSMGESWLAATSEPISNYGADLYDPIRRCPKSNGGVVRPPRRFYPHRWRDLVLHALRAVKNPCSMHETSMH
jgi:hypothetical protein